VALHKRSGAAANQGDALSKVVPLSPEAAAVKHRQSFAVDLQARLEALEDSFFATLQEIRAIRAELKKRSDQSPSLEKLLDAHEVAELLGQDKAWLYQQARAKKIPSIRLGKYVKFSPLALQKWLDRQQTP